MNGSRQLRPRHYNSIDSGINNLKIKTYIIHLKRATARNAQVKEIIKHAPAPATILDAVDAMGLTDSNIKKFFHSNLHKPHYPFALRDTEVACFLSHRKAWQQIIDDDLDGALIIEDDMSIDSPDFLSAYDMAIRNFTCDQFIRFPIKSRERPGIIIDKNETHRLFYPTHIAVGMTVQLVGVNAAKILLKNTDCFDRPVDTLLQMNWITKVNLATILPAGTSEISDAIGGSTIGSKAPLMKKLKREILRPLYRLRIRFMQSRYKNDA